jgi:pimeloyl-ACP methyl ester carboxylesterase
MSPMFENAVTKQVLIDGVPFAYREIGAKTGVPIICLHHVTAALDDWDPRMIDGLAQERPVIIFDNRGVGGSGGETPDTVERMAQDAVRFIAALGLTQIDLFGYSLGGFIAQVVAETHPALVRRLILAGTSARGGEGISDMNAVLQNALARGAAENKHPKELLFFPPSEEGSASAAAFLVRLGARQQDRDIAVTNDAIGAQMAAVTRWGLSPVPAELNVRQSVLVVNGDHDLMAPTINSVELARKLPNARLSIFPAAGHGAIFQHHTAFLDQALSFLRD